jgi:hypothetical protein
VYINDDGYRNAVFAEYPGANCRVIGTILPIIE